jgi:hypothetical protein
VYLQSSRENKKSEQAESVRERREKREKLRTLPPPTKPNAKKKEETLARLLTSPRFHAMSTTSVGLRRTSARRPAIRPTWCCSFTLDPQTPQSKPYSPICKPPSLTSRRMLSPGRVSPIDSDQIDPDPIQDLQEKRLSSVEESRDGGSFRGFRVRLKGREGEVVILNEKEKEMICENSEVFRGLIGGVDLTRGFEIELDGVDSLEGFKATIGLMREIVQNEMQWLAKIGVSGAIEILEVRILKLLLYQTLNW